VSHWIAPAIAFGSVAWLALVVTAPLLNVAAAGILYAVGSLICHQLPERSFYVEGFQLPVCARCFGLYAGAAAGSIVGALAGRADRGRPAPRPAVVFTAIAALPTVASLAIEWGAGWPVSNVVRAAAGLSLGFAVAFVVVRAVATLHYDECAPRRPIGHGQPPAST
jgi:uncharacterized membrane protein